MCYMQAKIVISLDFKQICPSYSKIPRIAKAGFSKVSVYFSGENLWSWSPLYRHTKDYDVTVITKGSDNDLTSGNKGDGFNYPTMRNLSLGISITY